METAVKENTEKSVIEILKALVVSVSATMLFILLFALCIKWFDLPDAVILPINQVIKALSLLIGMICGFKSAKGGWRKGLITGLLYIGTTFLIFSLLEGVFSFDKALVIDILLGGVMGIISGIIAVNLRRR